MMTLDTEWNAAFAQQHAHATAGNVDPIVCVLMAACALAIVVALMIQYGPRNSVWMQRGRQVPETRNDDAVAIIELFDQVTLNLGREPTLAEFDEILKCRAVTMFTNEHGYGPLSPNPSPIAVTDSDSDHDSNESDSSDDGQAPPAPDTTINVYGIDAPPTPEHAPGYAPADQVPELPQRDRAARRPASPLTMQRAGGFLLTLAVPSDAAGMQDESVQQLQRFDLSLAFTHGSEQHPQPSSDVIYGLVVLVAVLAVALVFVLFRRKPPSSDATTQTKEAAAVSSTKQPPMAVTVNPDNQPLPHIVEHIVWIESEYSAANVQFLRRHYARWCSDRNCWYMLAASSTAAHRNQRAVLERFNHCSEPSRTDDGRFKKSTCTKPCYVCNGAVHETLTWPSGAGSTTRRRLPQAATAPLYLLTLFTCMVPSDAATESMFSYHMRTAQWQLLAIYGVILVAAAGHQLKWIINSGALAGLCVGVKDAGVCIAARIGGILCSMLRSIDSSALTIDGFMENVRKRHLPSLTAYYSATAMFCIAFAAGLAMAGMPSAWCAAFPLAMSMAALLLVQQRGGTVASIKLPGSKLLMVLQGCLLAIWGCGALPTSVLLAPLPAVAIYIAAAHSVSRKLRPLNAGVFLLIILILAGSVPACFIDVEVLWLDRATI